MQRNPEFYPYASNASTGFNDLRKHVITGDVQALRECLAQGPSQYHVDFPDYKGNSCLHLAVETQNLECVRLLLACRASVRKLGMDEETPLHMAARRSGASSGDILAALLHSDPEAVQFCDSRCNEKAQDMIALYTASSSSSSSSSSSPASASSTGPRHSVKTPLHIAIKAGNISAVRILLAAGASVYARFISHVDKDKDKDQDESEDEDESEGGVEASGDENEDERDSTYRVTSALQLAMRVAKSSSSEEAGAILSMLKAHLVATESASASSSASVAVEGKGKGKDKRYRARIERDESVGHEELDNVNHIFTTVAVAGSSNSKSNPAYYDMMKHMWDEEAKTSPGAQRQAEFEASMIMHPPALIHADNDGK